MCDRPCVFYKQALNTGDRVQAKWEDGRMYYGKILRVHSGQSVSINSEEQEHTLNEKYLNVCCVVLLFLGEADILFDDGVEYTAPLSSVRKRVCLTNTKKYLYQV